jgi:hypothetical protein
MLLTAVVSLKQPINNMQNCPPTTTVAEACIVVELDVKVATQVCVNVKNVVSTDYEEPKTRYPHRQRLLNFWLAV